MKLYLAGPMRGYPEFNFPAFHAAAAWLRAQGHQVFSPAENDLKREGEGFDKRNAEGNVDKAMKGGFSLRTALAEDLEFICREAEGIALLPGWEASSGATAEHATSKALDHCVIFVPKWVVGFNGRTKAV